MFKKVFFILAIILASGLSNPGLAQSDVAMATVNVNLASAEQLAEVLDGVGMTRAAAIVQYRENYGKFERVEELLMVRGIGESVLETNRSRISLE